MKRRFKKIAGVSEGKCGQKMKRSVAVSGVEGSVKVRKEDKIALKNENTQSGKLTRSEISHGC